MIIGMKLYDVDEAAVRRDGEKAALAGQGSDVNPFCACPVLSPIWLAGWHDNIDLTPVESITDNNKQ